MSNRKRTRRGARPAFTGDLPEIGLPPHDGDTIAWEDVSGQVHGRPEDWRPSGWRDDTITSFPAITDSPPPEEPAPGPDCPCGSGKPLAACDGRPPAGPQRPADSRPLLSCAPGVVSRMWRARVGNGQWDDIPALADAAHARIHFPALTRQRQIRDGLAASRHDLGAVFARTPALLPDARLAAELHAVEARLAAAQQGRHRAVTA